MNMHMSGVLCFLLQISLISAQIRFGVQPRQEKAASFTNNSPKHVQGRLPSWRNRNFPPILSEARSSSSQEDSSSAIFFGHSKVKAEKKRGEVKSNGLPYKPTEDCKKYNKCDFNSNEYPSTKIMKALRRGSPTTRQLIKSLTNAEPTYYARNAEITTEQKLEISLRIGGFESNDVVTEENVCRTEKRRIEPRGALNTKGEFKWILNLPAGNEEYVQVVDTTVCRDAGSECLGGQIFGHQTECKQEYTEHKLLVLDNDGEEVVIDTFRFPSCCTCQKSTRLSLRG